MLMCPLGLKRNGCVRELGQMTISWTQLAYQHEELKCGSNMYIDDKIGLPTSSQDVNHRRFNLHTWPNTYHIQGWLGATRLTEGKTGIGN